MMKILATSLLLVFSLLVYEVESQTTWTGAVDRDWHKNCNWNTLVVPTCSDNVLIPTIILSGNKPIISRSACCLTIEVQNVDYLEIQDAGDLQVGNTLPLPNIDINPYTTPSVSTIQAASGISSGNFTANWSASNNATSYYLDVSTNPSFSSFVTGYNNLNVGNVLSKNVTGLASSTLYYYRVRAYNPCGTSTSSTTASTTTTGVSANCIPSQSTCVGTTITDTRDSKVYNIVQIGSQCWMQQNLNVGNRITTPTAQTNNTTIEKYCYDNLETNCNVYGGLYQWNEMLNYTNTVVVPPGAGCYNPGPQGICPTGWHVPTDEEWKCLEEGMGMPVGELGNNAWRGGAGSGNNVGGKLKEDGTAHWTPTNQCVGLAPPTPGGTCNISGFTGLAGGYYLSSNVFNEICNDPTPTSPALESQDAGWWWTSTGPGGTTPGTAQMRHLLFDVTGVDRQMEGKNKGFSVRCVKNP